MNKSYFTAYYTDDDDLLKGIGQLREKGVEIIDVMTPFPVHGLDKAIGLRRSRLSRVAFWGGTVGALIGFFFQAWVFTIDYPLNFGGKPYLSVPSFMPVTFEMAVLFAAYSIVFAYLIYFKLGPGAKPIIHDERSTDDRFLLVVKAGEPGESENIKKALSEAGAEGIILKA